MTVSANEYRVMPFYRVDGNPIGWIVVAQGGAVGPFATSEAADIFIELDVNRRNSEPSEMDIQ